MTDVTAGPGPAPAGGWTTATVQELHRPAPDVVVLRLAVDDRVQHRPGQHYVVRLRAEDGYTASRSYSVASAPDDPLVELYVERLADGEVSGFLADVVRPGDRLEVRGPLGGWFVWDGTRPVLAVGGGSGAAPLVAMLRHARATGRPDDVCLVVAARALARLPYAEELVGGCQVVALSGEVSPAGRPAGRLAAADLAPLLRPGQQVFVCGSTGFTDHAGRLLLQLGVDPADVRVEQFGPSS